MHKYPLLKCIIFLTCCNIYTTSFSQEKTSFIALVDRLQQIEKKFKVHFSYNHTFLGKILVPDLDICSTIASCLEDISKTTPVRFEADGASSYLILPERKEVSFKVVDSDTQESLPSLRYRINEHAEQYLYPNGSTYTIQDLFPLDSIRIVSEFYKSIHLSIADLQKMQTPIQLERDEIFLTEVLINGYLTQGIDTKLSDHTLQINMKSLGLLAGETDGDTFNILKNIPGIHTPSSKPGSFNFRGSTFDQTLIQIDDIPIYHNGHFFGAMSPYNPSVVDHIEIQRSTLAAKWGGRVGGLINITTSNQVADSTTYTIVANTLHAGVTLTSSIIKDKLGISFAARSGYPNSKTPKLEALSDLNFQGSRLENITDQINSSDDFDTSFYDINAKIVYNINDTNSLSISFIDIQNTLSAVLEDTVDNEIDFRYADLNNWGVTTKWEKRFSENFSGEIRLSKSSLFISNSSEGFFLEELTSRQNYTNRINDLRFISEATYTFSPNTSLETGYSLTNHEIRFDKVIEENTINTQENQNGSIHSFYITTQKNWGKKLTTTLGIHSDYYAPLQEWYVDPRISMSISVSDELFLKASTGSSRQFIQKKLRDDFDDFNLNNQFWFLPDSTISTLVSYQTMVGTLYDKAGVLIDLELYSRKIHHVTKIREGGQGQLRSLGADLFVKKRWGALETLLSYSLNKVETDFDAKAPIFFDQRHIFTITGLLNFSQWSFAVSWGYFSGMPVVLPTIDTANEERITGIPYSDRFPSQHLLDISATYSFTNKTKTWRSIIGVSIANLYDQDNIVNVFQNSPDIGNLYRKAVGFAPNVQVSFKF